MAKIYRLKRVPAPVLEYFRSNYPEVKGFEYRFYWYVGSKGQKVYGCEVMKDGSLHHNATQMTAEDYETINNIPY